MLPYHVLSSTSPSGGNLVDGSPPAPVRRHSWASWRFRTNGQIYWNGGFILKSWTFVWARFQFWYFSRNFKCWRCTGLLWYSFKSRPRTKSHHVWVLGKNWKWHFPKISFFFSKMIKASILKLYESFRREPGWRFTAGYEYGGMLELVEDFGRTDKFIEMKGAFWKVEHSFELFFNSNFFSWKLKC